MSDSFSEGRPPGSATAFDTAEFGAAIPRRILRARREAAAALALGAESTGPTWSVAPAPAFGEAVPLDDELF